MSFTTHENQIIHVWIDFYDKKGSETKKFIGLLYDSVHTEEWGGSSDFCEDRGRVELWEKDLEKFCECLERIGAEVYKNTSPYLQFELTIHENPTLQEELEEYIEQRMLEFELTTDDLEDEDDFYVSTKEMYKQTNEFPVKYSQEMTAYIKELANMAVNLRRIYHLGQVFSMNLLVSMDDGWGYSKFLHCIKKTMAPFYMGEEESFDVSEQKITKEEGIRGWDKYPSAMKELSRRLTSSNRFSIASFDLTEWLEDLENKELLDYLRRITQYSTRSFIVFRVPCMDRKELSKVERILATVMPLRTLMIPPVSVENMMLYTKEKIREKGFVVKGDLDELLEKWISQEKNAGVFYGYKSLDRMVTDLIYKKLLSVALYSEPDAIRSILQDDIRNMLQEEIVVTDRNPYELLDELIGMGEVKQKVREIVAQVKAQKAMLEQGKEVDPPTLHMMFLGNPGTGKTTVARIIGMIFKKEGILGKGLFYEKLGSDFLQEHVGETVHKTREFCRDGHENVLFIDEAYGMSINHSTGNTSDNVLPTLIAEMENHRHDMCVIFAGYQDEMNEFVKLNSGLSSRIPHVVDFPNYSREELLEIFFQIIDRKFEYEEAFKKEITEYIMNLPDEFIESKEFSNGRFVRNLFENLWGKAAYRISLTGETEIILKKEDAVTVIQEEGLTELNEEKPRKIGFI